MSKKKNKNALQAWQDDVQEEKQRNSDLEEQQTALFYAGNKRDDCNWPYPDTLARLGFTDAANKVSQAYDLLAEAEYSFNKQLNPDQYS